MKKIRSGILLLLTVSLSRASELSSLPSIGLPSIQGIASWYGRAHEGRRTASGAVFRRSKLTAAHRTARFGTRYLVFYKDQVVEVLVNDRGPYAHGRGLDLSKGAADKIGLTGSGVGRVSVTRLN